MSMYNQTNRLSLFLFAAYESASHGLTFIQQRSPVITVRSASPFVVSQYCLRYLQCLLETVFILVGVYTGLLFRSHLSG
jgi:hypothetical protein